MPKFVIHKKGTPPERPARTPVEPKNTLKFASKSTVAEPQSLEPVTLSPQPEAVSNNDREVAELYHAELDARKDQIFAYHEWVQAMASDWTLESAAEILMILIRAIFYDAAAIVITTPEGSDFLKPACRGFRYSPGRQILETWKQSLVPGESRGLHWSKLIDTLENPSPVSLWLATEGLCSCGYIPVQDGSRIYGFILIGSREGHCTDEFSNTILMLCAQRLSLALAFNRIENENDRLRQSSGAPISTAPRLSSQAATDIRELRVQLSVAQDFAHLLKNAAALPAEQITMSASGCSGALQTALAKLDHLIADLPPES